MNKMGGEKFMYRLVLLDIGYNINIDVDIDVKISKSVNLLNSMIHCR